MKRIKKILSIVAAVCMMVVLGSVNDIEVNAAAASTLKIASASSPNNIVVGKCFDCKGTITSNYKITNVTGTIKTSAGKVVYTKSVNPNAYSYSLVGGKIDCALYFNKLAIGNYTYTITAKDASGKNLTLVSKAFAIIKAPSTLKIANATQPSSIIQGAYFDCKGTVTSNYNITNVTGKITSSDGKTALYTKAVKPDAKSYSLYGNSIDTALLFNKLTVGTYYYKVTATDASGKTIELVNSKFAVVKGSGTFLWPVSATTTKNLSSKYVNNNSEFHSGIDIAAPAGRNIFAAADGTVVGVYYDTYGTYGNCVIINHGNNIWTLYAHCKSLNVKNGQKVKKGDVIATVGSTGKSTGNHLHFEVRSGKNEWNKNYCKDPLTYSYTYK